MIKFLRHNYQNVKKDSMVLCVSVVSKLINCLFLTNLMYFVTPGHTNKIQFYTIKSLKGALEHSSTSEELVYCLNKCTFKCFFIPKETFCGQFQIFYQFVTPGQKKIKAVQSSYKMHSL